LWIAGTSAKSVISPPAALNLGLYQKDINVAWDLAPHDISIILHIMEEFPHAVNCRGVAHITPGVEDVTSMWFEPSAKIVRPSSTIAGSTSKNSRDDHRRQPPHDCYDDVAQLEKLRVFDARVNGPLITTPSLNFNTPITTATCMSLHQKEEPLKAECQHFPGLHPSRNGAL